MRVKATFYKHQEWDWEGYVPDYAEDEGGIRFWMDNNVREDEWTLTSEHLEDGPVTIVTEEPMTMEKEPRTMERDKFYTEEELVTLIKENLIQWATEVANESDTNFGSQYENERDSFLRVLEGRL